MPPYFLTSYILLTTTHSYGTDVYLHLNRLSSSSEPLQ
jgi:hypothetical protein